MHPILAKIRVCDLHSEPLDYRGGASSGPVTEDDFGDLGLDEPGGEEDWLAEMDAMMGCDEDHPEDVSEEWLQEGLEMDRVNFSDFEVVGNVTAPQPITYAGTYTEEGTEAIRDSGGKGGSW